MKAIRLRRPFGQERFEHVDIADPGAPGAGEIRVRLHASSLNAHDLAVVLGQLPVEDNRIPLSDGAGVVEAVGAGVQEFAVGDHVVSTFFPRWLAGGPGPLAAGFATTPGDGIDGYACEVAVRPATAFTHAPRGWSHLEAATLTTAGLTAWRALVVAGGLKTGDTVLTLGTGGVSVFALQLAKAAGATVIATSSSDDKLARAAALGADHGINYRQHPEWSKEVLALTGGRGVDHVVEVGGPGTLPQSMRSARVGGHIALIGALTGFADMVPTAELMLRQQRVTGIGVGSREHQLDLVRAVETTGLRPVIDRSFALDDLADAFRLQQAGGHFGKIGIDYSMASGKAA
ncbi:MAG: NAD(P)-dependent alcohol dehydrogenase [Aromatoleum sp.]|jgi:NADPH:quinone reductase-like Zn-dependent oxidoreductase|uniref:zinc-dependent alcohol dehydrogenase family protein n=1 Tax=Aromatoleum sp. TaxID=2307007 RepID=UPI0028955839|nr:NAD(P)-dependent alcohol dehydrogenase [Aromatoleum sp.]MDT3672092.1 NAD(P)-dependent alcohol dehydrogenase [Aromatoleum sp.]